MSDLTEFLRARLDEDETEAQECVRYPVPDNSPDLNDLWIYNQGKRMLAEVAVKRRILDGLPVYDGEPVGMIRTLTGRAYWQAELTLARLYADHPDFDQAWR